MPVVTVWKGRKNKSLVEYIGIVVHVAVAVEEREHLALGV